MQGGLTLVSDQGVQTNGAKAGFVWFFVGDFIRRRVWRSRAAYGKSVWFRHPLLVSSRRRFLADPTGFAKPQSAGDGGKTEFVARESTP